MMQALRFTAETLSRNYTMRKRLPSKWGRLNLSCSPGNNLRVLLPGKRGWDQHLLAFVDSLVKPGSVVWDIGANMGVFAFPAATRAKFVLAVEADPFNVALLERSRTDNPSLSVQVLGAAVTESHGVARLRLSKRGRASNSLEGAHESSQAGGWRNVTTVCAITLDGLLDHFPAPDLIKIDVEGAEHFVLRGAARVLANRPTILVETARANKAEVTSLLREKGYDLFSVDRGPTQPVPVSDSDTFVELLAIATR